MQKKFFLLPVFIIFFLFSGSVKVFANVYKISFVSQVQTLDVGATSSAIKVEVEDQDSTTTKATETIYLNLATSGSGEFSSNSTTWKSVATLPSDYSTSSIFISSSSASRSFYYKGLSEGQQTLTVSAKSKSGIVYGDIQQTINIGVVASSTPDPDPIPNQNNSAPTSTVSNTQTVTKIVTRTVYISTHSDPEDLTDYDPNSSLESGAGRERLSYVGVPVEFSEKHRFSKSSMAGQATFIWSFGDGFEASGENTTHTYKYPGEYNVILNGLSQDSHSVSRTKVVILAPNITLDLLPEGIVVSNKNNKEMNLGDWKLAGESNNFIFAKDTILGAGKSITLSYDDTKLGFSNIISLKNPSDKIVLSDEFKNEIAAAPAKTEISVNKKIDATVPEVSKVENKIINTATVFEAVNATSSTSTVTIAVAEKPVGFFGHIWGGFTKIAKIFYNF